ncbi:MAG: hypothetical protein IPP71_00215 [Bacteroidetes bacterium]|nr:hypothetical protein [Bacteroidota bacterium]
MNTRKTNKLKNSLRLRISMRMIFTVGISAAIIAVGIFFYLQFTNSESTKAENAKILTQDQLPVDLNVDQMITTSVDTNVRQGNKYKIAKPLSLTPTISK